MTARSRPMPLDSGLATLDSQPRKYVRFDPQLNTGHILQIIVLIVGGFTAYGALKSDQQAQRSELEQVKAVASVERAQNAQALADLKTDMKEMRASLNDVKESLAVLRGRAADTGGRK